MTDEMEKKENEITSLQEDFQNKQNKINSPKEKNEEFIKIVEDSNNKIDSLKDEMQKKENEVTSL
jgi:peptidoglycan hydrolase CwlO-like protein